MQRHSLIAIFLIAALAGGLTLAGPQVSKKGEEYGAVKGAGEAHAIYQLRDARRNLEARVAPGVGNIAFEFRANGKDVFIPPESLESYLQERWFCCGNPFLAPWANRIDGDHYFFEGKKYLLNDALGNILRVPPKDYPLHGLLAFEPRWEVIDSGGSARTGAFITTRLEFYKYPDLMAQFPFAHVYEVTHRLKDGKLEVTTRVTNVGKSRMPVLFGYHPYFRPDGPREEWTVGLGARQRWLANEALIATGETQPAERFLPGAAEGVALGRKFVDDVFSDFARDREGRGRIWVKGRAQKIEVVFDRNYDFAVVYAPLRDPLICIEPQTGPTNAFNLNHAGKFPGLVTLEPGKTYEATFWIVPSGF
jgi:aldose 1-epimerase